MTNSNVKLCAVNDCCLLSFFRKTPQDLAIFHIVLEVNDAVEAWEIIKYKNGGPYDICWRYDIIAIYKFNGLSDEINNKENVRNYDKLTIKMEKYNNKYGSFFA